MARSEAAAWRSVWATNSGGRRVMHLFPETKVVAAYGVPYEVLTRLNSNPHGLPLDSTKTPWFAGGRGEKIGMIDAATRKMTEYDLPSHRLESLPSQILLNFFTL